MNRDHVRLHEFADGYLLEVVRDEGGGDVTAISVELDRTDPDERILAPRETLPESYEESIRTHLESTGYALTD